MMKPVLERLAEEYRGKVAFVAVDCEVTTQNRDLAQEAAIRCMMLRDSLAIYAFNSSDAFKV